MYKSAENKAGSKWVLDKGKGKQVRLSPIVVDKKIVYSYILEKYLPAAVLEICSSQGGRASHKDLSGLGQSDICADVPKAVHPYTLQGVNTPKVLSFFQPSPNLIKRMRIASSDEDSDGEPIAQTDDDDASQHTPPKKTRRSHHTPTIVNGYIPHGIVSTIRTMIAQLNAVYSDLPHERKSEDLASAYRVKLQRQSSM